MFKARIGRTGPAWTPSSGAVAAVVAVLLLGAARCCFILFTWLLLRFNSWPCFNWLRPLCLGWTIQPGRPAYGAWLRAARLGPAQPGTAPWSRPRRPKGQVQATADRNAVSTWTLQRAKSGHLARRLKSHKAYEVSAGL